MLSSRTFKTRKPEICLFLLLLSTVLLYTGCFTLLMASNQRLRLFAGDIVARTITTSSLLPLFYVFPIVALLLAFIAAFKSWRRVALTICLLLVCNIVGAVVWHLIAFRSPVQFFEFVDVGSGCPELDTIGDSILSTTSDYAYYCEFANVAFYFCLSFASIIAVLQTCLFCVLFKKLKQH